MTDPILPKRDNTDTLWLIDGPPDSRGHVPLISRQGVVTVEQAGTVTIRDANAVTVTTYPMHRVHQIDWKKR